MKRSKEFHKSGKTSDEYYTIYEEVEYIFKNIIILDQLKDKIIYCPFDSDESNFVIYLKEHKDEIKYKELWYTSDDFKNHEGLIKEADFIISNPPFSIIDKEILPMFERYNKKFFLFGSLMKLYYYIKYYTPDECKYIRRERYEFITPHICEQSNDYRAFVSGTIYLTNLEINNYYKTFPNKKFLTKSFSEINEIYGNIIYSTGAENKYLNIDKMVNYPNDYYDPVFCPLTALEYKYNKHLKYLGNETCSNRRIDYSDGKSRYVRVLMMRK